MLPLCSTNITFSKNKQENIFTNVCRYWNKYLYKFWLKSIKTNWNLFGAAQKLISNTRGLMKIVILRIWCFFSSNVADTHKLYVCFWMRCSATSTSLSWHWMGKVEKKHKITGKIKQYEKNICDGFFLLTLC